MRSSLILRVLYKILYQKINRKKIIFSFYQTINPKHKDQNVCCLVLQLFPDNHIFPTYLLSSNLHQVCYRLWEPDLIPGQGKPWCQHQEVLGKLCSISLPWWSDRLLQRSLRSMQVMEHTMKNKLARWILWLPLFNKEGGQKAVLKKNTKEWKYLTVNNNIYTPPENNLRQCYRKPFPLRKETCLQKELLNSIILFW